MNENHSRELVGLLASLAASSRISESAGMAAIRVLAPMERAQSNVDDVIEALRGFSEAECRRVLTELHTNRLREAQRFHESRRENQVDDRCDRVLLGNLPLDVPIGWWRRKRQNQAIQQFALTAKDHRYAQSRKQLAPETANFVAKRYQQSVAEVPWPNEWEGVFPDEPLEALQNSCEEKDVRLASLLDSFRAGQRAHADPAPSVLDAQLERWKSAVTQAEQQAALDLLCSYPKMEVAERLANLITEPWARERAELIFTLRFGKRFTPGWEAWRTWLLKCEDLLQDDINSQALVINQNAAELFLLWLKQQDSPSTELIERLDAYCDQTAVAVNPDSFVERWSEGIPPGEWNALLGISFESVTDDKLPEPIDSDPAPVVEDANSDDSRQAVGLISETADSPRPKPLSSPKPAPMPAKPSLWEDHLQPFFVENWYMVAGVVMAIAGSSLLAYYTWDKHWIVRYSLMPLLLAGFTMLLGWLGTWIERRDEKFAETAAILRGAAIGLLPINFMVVVLLSDDPLVGARLFVVPLMAILYIAIFGWGVSRWCQKVDASLRWVLGGPLILVGSLVMLGPIVHNLAAPDRDTLRWVVGASFYIGFLVMAGMTVQFLKKILTNELAKERRVPWFFGATLVITFVQAFLWSHGYLKLTPHVATYAPLVILAGGLVLLGERRALELRETPQDYTEESFIGYAVVLLGTIMGAANPTMRIAAFALGGLVWLRQASTRRDLLHYHIGLTFFLGAIGSMGFLDSYPKEWFSVLGLVATFVMAGIGFVAKRMGNHQLQRATQNIESTTLLLTSIAAMIAQWQYQSEPLITAGILLVVAAGFATLAWRDRQLWQVHIAMMLLALALPYLGCVDMAGRTLEGNTMAFGLASLSFAWLILNWIVPTPLIRDARSTVLWFYGGLALIAMGLRTFAEPIVTPNLTWSRAAMDYFGPLMMAAALVFASWYSRSLIPAAMAAVIAIILFPELKAQFQTTFTRLDFGSGFGSAASGLGLLIACSVLRRLPALQEFGEGDRFMGRELFPLRRYDYTLFTWPLLVSVFFLTVRTDTWTFGRHVIGGTMSLKTTWALGVTAVTWPLIAVYFRQFVLAPLATFAGCLVLGLGVVFSQTYWGPDLHWSAAYLATGLILQALYFLYHFGFRETDWAGRVLEIPLTLFLEIASVLLAGIGIGQLIVGQDALSPGLLAFVATQLVWHSVRTPYRSDRLIPNRNVPLKETLYSCLLFALTTVFILAQTTSGAGPLFPRLSLAENLGGMLGLITAVQVAYLLFEFQPNWRERLRSLAEPFLFLGTFLLLGCLLGAIGDYFLSASLDLRSILLLTGVALLTARAQASTLFLLITVSLLYCVSPYWIGTVEGLNELSTLDKLEDLLQPFRLGVFALLLSAMGVTGQQIAARIPRLIAGPFAQPFYRFPQVGWLFGPALGFSTLAVIAHTGLSEYRNASQYLWVPYLAAVTWAVVCWNWPLAGGAFASVVWVSIGNIHAIRNLGGDFLRDHGLSEIHLVSLGLAASLIQLTLVRLVMKRDDVTAFVHKAGLALAGLVLALLAINYVGDPNLAEIPWMRFVISGAMAYLAGFYFRGAARHPAPGEEPYRELSEGLYHFGVTIAIWCGVLLIPWLRTPAVALYALGVPLLYFSLRAETGWEHDREVARRYRNSAAVLGFAGLACYVFRPFVQVVFFPDEPVLNTAYYHNNAPLTLVVSIVLLRLHALGGTAWLAVYAGLGLVTGSYFLLTWLPNMSPFDEPVAGAWCAIGLAHFWILVTHQRSPLRTFFQRLGAIDGQQWAGLRRVWGFWLLGAVEFLLICGLFEWKDHPFAMAPLLAGSASVLIHLGLIRQAPLYLGIAGLQLIAALHADFLVESYLPKSEIIWALLGIWALCLVLEQFLPKLRNFSQMASLAVGMGGLVFGHVLYHHPASNVGLWGFAVGSVLIALTPRPQARCQTNEERFSSGLLLGIPLWLVYFSQAKLLENGLSAAADVWPILTTLAALFFVGVFARVTQSFWAAHYDQLHRERYRLFDQTLSLIAGWGAWIHLISLQVVSALVVLLHLVQITGTWPRPDLALFMVMYLALAVAWYFEGERQKTIGPYFCLEASLLGFLVAVRMQILETAGFWKVEYDVWASLLASCGMTLIKHIIDKQPRHIRYPFLSVLFALPVFSGTWVLAHHMGTDMVLLVIGLQSLLFAFLGRDDRESPYHVISIVGFVAFLMIVFWDRLELRYLHAYTIPVGVGVLVLLQLFKNRISVDVRNRVRFITLLVMVSSAGYYALLDNRHPLAFHFTLIVLCLATMALGSFFRIRLYVAIGFCGLLTDVASIVYRVMVEMERGSRMTMIGSLVLLIGLGLVFGTLYYKTHEKTLKVHIDRWRQSWGGWE